MEFITYNPNILEKRYRNSQNFTEVHKQYKLITDSIGLNSMIYFDIQSFIQKHSLPSNNSFSDEFIELLRQKRLFHKNNLTDIIIDFTGTNFCRINYARGMGMAYLIIPCYKNNNAITLEFKPTDELKSMHQNGYIINPNGKLHFNRIQITTIENKVSDWYFDTTIAVREGQYYKPNIFKQTLDK